MDYGDDQYTAEILTDAVPSIKRLGMYLKNIHTDKAYTSELLRCLQTSQIVTDMTGKEFEKFPLLNEFTEKTFEEFKKRAQKLIDKLEENKKTTYLLCTHGAVISALKHLLIFGEYKHENLMDFPVAGSLMIIDRSGSEVMDFNG